MKYEIQPQSNTSIAVPAKSIVQTASEYIYLNDTGSMEGFKLTEFQTSDDMTIQFFNNDYKSVYITVEPFAHIEDGSPVPPAHINVQSFTVDTYEPYRNLGTIFNWKPFTVNVSPANAEYAKLEYFAVNESGYAPI
ncbi:hypothetical protein OGY35_23875 [Citrobacter sp. Ct235]|uniref:hypothetical protein n=1 Tax=Citrobacter sp. Ct235 TaxID=2985157 RepID=UPI0025779DC0|nr:hypothetical protein [Citrobacter sp. Ct235]MDM2738395.1 hypothetical protein [Citrobacter sp. Ct235]